MENLFGVRLRRVRKSRGYTQEMLGKECGACNGTIRDWEKGLRLPNTYYLKEICIALGVSADYLLGLKQKRPEAPGERRDRL